MRELVFLRLEELLADCGEIERSHYEEGYVTSREELEEMTDEQLLNCFEANMFAG